MPANPSSGPARPPDAFALDHRGLGRESLIVFAFVVMTVVMTWPWARILRDAVPDPGDSYLNSWILWWDYHQTFHDPRHLFEAPILYPYHDTLAFSEHNYGIAVLFFPLFALGLRPLTVHGIAELVGFALSGYGAFRLARTLSGSTAAAWVAGIAFGFAPYRFHQLGHLNYMFCGWIPLLVEGLVRFCRRRTWRRAAWLGVAFAMNALTCVHWFVLTLIPLAVTGVFLSARYRLWPDRDLWLRGGTCLAAAGLVLLPFLLPYLEVSERYGLVRTVEESARYSAQVGNWLSADSANRIWHGFGPAPEAGERALFPGLLPLLLALAAFYFARTAVGAEGPSDRGFARWRGSLPAALDAVALGCLIVAGLAFGYAPSGIKLLTLDALRITDPVKPLALALLVFVVRFCLAPPKLWRSKRERGSPPKMAMADQNGIVAIGAIWTVVGFCGSLGMNFPFHRWLFEHVFLFRSVRVPARWGMLAVLGLALLAGAGAQRLVAALRRRRPRWRTAPWYAAICAALLIEQHALPLRLVRGEVDPDALTTHLRDTPMRGGVAHLPAGGEEGNHRYVLRQADHRRPLVTAVSGFSTPISSAIETLSRTQPIPDRFLELLEETPVSYLAVHRSRLRPELRSATETMLHRGMAAGRLRYVRSFPGSGIQGNAGADLFAVVGTEPEASALAEWPYPAPIMEWDALIRRDPINLLGQYQAWAQAVHRLYVASFGRMPRYSEFLADVEALGRGVLIDPAADPALLEDRLRQLTAGWIERPDFRQLYQAVGDGPYVDALAWNAGITLAPPERTALLERLGSAARTPAAAPRAQVLLHIVNSPAFRAREDIRSLVLLHYFGYLHRNPDDAPDGDLRGFEFWVREVQVWGESGRLARGFMASGEYEHSGRN